MAERGFRQIWRSNSGLRVAPVYGVLFIKVESWNLQVEVIGLGADVTGNKGWVVVELDGEEEDIVEG